VNVTRLRKCAIGEEKGVKRRIRVSFAVSIPWPCAGLGRHEVRRCSQVALSTSTNSMRPEGQHFLARIECHGRSQRAARSLPWLLDPRSWLSADRFLQACLGKGRVPIWARIESLLFTARGNGDHPSRECCPSYGLYLSVSSLLLLRLRPDTYACTTGGSEFLDEKTRKVR